MSGAAEPGVRACTAGHRGPATVSLRPRDPRVHRRHGRAGLAQRAADHRPGMAAGRHRRGGLRRPRPRRASRRRWRRCWRSCWPGPWSPGPASSLAGRSRTRVKRQLRGALLRRVAALGPGAGRARSGPARSRRWPRAGSTPSTATSRCICRSCSGGDRPVAVVVALLASDWISAVIIAVTLPLIPVFMALVGRGHARADATRSCACLQRLAGHFLDVVAGLPTLKVFGRAKPQVAGDRATSPSVTAMATMATLRVTFLSSLMLELLATFSVALVAVAIGLRLLGGRLDLRDRAVRAGARARGLPAAAPARRQLPRQRRGRQPRPSRSSRCSRRRCRRAGTRTEIPDPASAGIAVDELDGAPIRAGAARRSTVSR